MGMMNRIKYWRERRKLSMQKLADAVGTTPSTINKLEKGYMALTQEWMMRLAEALGIEQRDLLIEPYGAGSGFEDNVVPYIPGPFDALKPIEHVGYFRPTNADLDEHPDRITSESVLVFDLNAVDIDKVKPGNICLFGLYDKSELLKSHGRLIGQYLPPNKLTSNSRSANWIIRLDDANLMYTMVLKGVMTHVMRKANA